MVCKLPTAFASLALTAILALTACANNTVDVRFDEEAITIWGFTVAKDAVTLHGYEHIPTPTPAPERPYPTAVTTRSPTAVSPGTATKLSEEHWFDDLALPQYFGSTVHVEGFIDFFREYRTVVWWVNEQHSDSPSGIRCNFPKGWARGNVELLETLRDNKAQVTASRKGN